MISFSDPKANYITHKKRIDAAISKVVSEGRYILGEEVSEFEKEFSNYIGVDYAVGVGSGTAAIHLALLACNIGPGDEVITVSHTATATIAAIELSGAKPVLVDIEPDFFTMDSSLLEGVITKATKAIIPVHLYGQAADLEKIAEVAKRYNLLVIEDCAQAHGASYRGSRLGSFGDVSCFSCYPTKNLGALGDAGIVATNNRDIFEKLLSLREYGWNDSRESQFPGCNSRLDEIQAAILRVKLESLDHANKQRQRVAAMYDESLCRVSVPVKRSNAEHVYHLYVIKCEKRDKLRAYLKENKCLSAVHYERPNHLHKSYRQLRSTSQIVTEALSGMILSLPIYPEISDEHVTKVIRLVNNFYSN